MDTIYLNNNHISNCYNFNLNQKIGQDTFYIELYCDKINKSFINSLENNESIKLTINNKSLLLVLLENEIVDLNDDSIKIIILGRALNNG